MRGSWGVGDRSGRGPLISTKDDRGAFRQPESGGAPRTGPASRAERPTQGLQRPYPNGYRPRRPLTGSMASAVQRAAEMAEKTAATLGPPESLACSIDMWLAPGTSVSSTFQPRPFRKALRAIDAEGYTVTSQPPATSRTGMGRRVAYLKGLLATRAAAVAVADPPKKAYRSESTSPASIR